MPFGRCVKSQLRRQGPMQNTPDDERVRHLKTREWLKAEDSRQSRMNDYLAMY